MKAKQNELEEQAQRTSKSKYNNLDIVLGSAAEVERVWSLANYILTNQRGSMEPIMFEALLYLKYNRRFWGPALIRKAYQNARAEKKSERLQKLLQRAQEYDELALQVGSDDEDDDENGDN